MYYAIGKSSGNAIWLNKEYTSPFALYQYFLSVGDNNVYKYMTLFTDLDDNTIQQYNKTSDNKDGLHMLAYNVTRYIHSEHDANKAVQTTQLLFNTPQNQRYDFESTSVSQHDIINALSQSVSTQQIQCSYDTFTGYTIVQLLVHINAVSSKSECRRLIQSGGIYINNVRVNDSQYKLSSDDIICDSLCIVRVGKNKQCVVVIKQ